MPCRRGLKQHSKGGRSHQHSPLTHHPDMQRSCAQFPRIEEGKRSPECRHAAKPGTEEEGVAIHKSRSQSSFRCVSEFERTLQQALSLPGTNALFNCPADSGKRGKTMFQIQKRNETALNPNEERALRSFNSQTRNEHCTARELLIHWPQQLVANTEKLCSRFRHATESRTNWGVSVIGRKN